MNDKILMWNTDKKYSIIYADPPWAYKQGNNHPRWAGDALKHYPTMDIETIKALPVGHLADKDCILYLWATFPNIQLALDTIKAWGFKYKTVGFTWVKLNKKNKKPFFGIGYYTKSNAEICLIATRGKTWKLTNSISSVLLEPIEGHSKKPDKVRDLIVQLSGNLPRIELFARQRADGWDAWGNEV